MHYFFSYDYQVDTNKICKYLLENTKSTKLMLNSHVKLISYDREDPDFKNSVTYIKNMKEYKKSYDYVVLTFPLTKTIKKQNFWLDILYRDFLDYEMNSLNTYIIDGKLNKNFFHTSKYSNRFIKMYSNDIGSSIKSIKTNLPIRYRTNGMGRVLYSVVLSNDEETHAKEKLYLDKIFKKGYQLLLKETIQTVPMFKKVKYTHTPFPNIIIDGIRRQRVFYLTGLEWLECSKESICISARNISYLIAKKELTKESYSQIIKSNSKKFNPNYLMNNNLAYFGFFSSFIALYFIKNTLNKFYYN